MKKFSKGAIVALSSVLALGVVGGGAAGAIALDKDTVTITADGATQTVDTRAKTVAQLLDQQGITLAEHDVIQPEVNTALSDGSAITIKYAKPLTLNVDGKTITQWTTALTLDEALAQLDLDDSKNLISTNRSTALKREGLQVEVITPKTVTITTKDGDKTVEVPGNATVGDALKAAGITLDDLDKVSAEPTTAVTNNQKIVYQDVHYRPIIVTSEIAFDVKEVEDATLPKGEKKVVTKGVKGEKQTFITQVYLDGKLVSNHHKTGEKVVKQPVAQVVHVGTKEVAKTTTTTTTTTTTPKTTSSENTTVTPKAGGYSGSCEASNYWDPQPVASGGMFDPWAMTAAHKTLPFGTKLKVTNTANGKSVVVTINDRGPYSGSRCLDLSLGAMQAVGGISSGVITAQWQVVS